MKITTSMKRYASSSWCRHTDNVNGGRTHKAVRYGKRVIRRQLNNYLNKLLKYD